MEEDRVLARLLVREAQVGRAHHAELPESVAVVLCVRLADRSASEWTQRSFTALALVER